MFPWLDLLLCAVIGWETLTGYLYGVKVSGIRAGTVIGALLLSLPFAANCAVYIRPRVEPVFWAAIGGKVVAVSSDQTPWTFLGPWQGILGIPAGTGNMFAERAVSLAVNITGLSFLTLVFFLCARLLGRFKLSSAPAQLGALVGLSGGILTVLIFLALAPVWALAEKGIVLSSALEMSGIVRILNPLIQRLVNIIAPFVS